MKTRVLKLYEKLSPAPSVIVLANSVEPHLDQTFFYVADIPSGIFEGSFEVVHPDGHVDLLTGALEEDTARQAAKHDPGVTVHAANGKDEIEGAVKKLVPNGAPIGLNFRELTHEKFLWLSKIVPDATWVDVGNAIQQTRVVKDAQEVERLERAAQIGSKVGEEIPGLLKAGMTELELAAEMEYRMNRHGASGRSFSTIVGFGPNSAEPHYSPQGHRLESGQSIVCDFGAIYRRYVSDITRSFHFGRTDAELKRVHETVQAAQAAALDVIRAGVPSKEVHLAAQKVVDASPWKGRFTHGLGHSIGLAVHDGWGMGPNSEGTLEEGMAITVEPGIYLTGHGGVRIEDDVIVTKSGYRFLTTTRREYIEVGA